MKENGYVYFIKPVGMYGPIKIGWSETPLERLKGLMAWSPFELELLATAPGPLRLEYKVHSRFARSHRRSEWFEPDTDLIVGISALRAGKSLDEAFDFSQLQGSIRKRVRRDLWWTPEKRLRVSYESRIRHALARLRRNTGVSHWEPPDVDEITSYARREVPYTAAEIARLDDFLANIEAQALTREQRYPPPKAVEAA